MTLIQNSFRSFAVMIDLNSDRVLIPLAIVVGLVGGAMIGAELAQLGYPPAH